MFKVSGLYGHVVRNNFLSLVLFLGFLFSFLLMATAFMLPALLFFDVANEPLSNFAGFAHRYLPWMAMGASAVFFFRFYTFTLFLKDELNFYYPKRNQEKELFRIVENLCIHMGLRKPKIAIMPCESRNAFACGVTKNSATVVVTEGLLRSLNEPELRVVIAHELAHIRNDDIRLMATANIMASINTTIHKLNPFINIGKKRAFIFAIIPVFWMIAIPIRITSQWALVLTNVSRLVISRSREFVADTVAVEITNDPSSLVSALRKVAQNGNMRGLDPSIVAMMIHGPDGGENPTHPSILERINVIKSLTGGMVIESVEPSAGFGQRKMEASTLPLETTGVFRAVAEQSQLPFSHAAKGTRSWVVLGVSGAIILLIWNLFAMRSMENFSQSHGRNTAGLAQGVKKPKSEYQLIKDLGWQDPLVSRCYYLDGYEVGDRGRYTLKTRNGVLVKGSSKYGWKSRIRMEKWLNAKKLQINAVTRARGDDGAVQAALDKYIAGREVNVQNAHRFFGNKGLLYMLKAYDSPKDKWVVRELKQRMADGRYKTPAADKPGAVNRINKLRLLTEQPDEFLPCRVRFERNRLAGSSLRGTVSFESTASFK